MEKDKSIYFFIAYFRKQKVNISDIEFVVPDNKDMHPTCVYFDELPKNKFYFYNQIFKVSKSAGKGKKGNNYHFEFQIDDENYVISFDSKGCTFIYDVNLEVGKRIIDIRRKVDQKKEYYQTIECFLKTFEKEEKNEALINDFYNETIKLYSIKKGFAFFIELFLKIYQKKDLCSQLMEIFKKLNENPKDIAKNMDRPPFLKEYTSKLKEIKSKVDTIIKNNEYNPIDFYGILLCYFNYYDYENFTSIIKKLYKKNQKIYYMKYYLFIMIILLILLNKILIFSIILSSILLKKIFHHWKRD